MRIRTHILLASWLVLSPGAVLSQPRLPTTPYEHGTQAFEHILKERGLNPITDIKLALADPEKSLVILLGHTYISEDWFAKVSLRQFIAQGGAVLIASDRGPSTEMVWHSLGIRIAQFKVRGVFVRPNSMYRGTIAECPLLQACTNPNKRSEFNLLRTTPNVATNRPSYLIFDEQEDAQTNRLDARRVFAQLPVGCAIDFGGREGSDRPSGSLDFGVAATHGKGRYIVLADHSIFINAMMVQLDNDNVPFAINLVDWLTEKGQRTQVILNGEDRIVRSDFNTNLDYIDPPLPHPDVLGPAADRLIDTLEQEDFINRLITQLVPLHRLLRGALLGLTIFGVAFALYRITAGKHRLDPAVAHLPHRLGDLPAAPGVALPTAAAARELARNALSRLAGAEVNPLVAPQVWAAGWHNRRTWTYRVRTLWEVAVGQRDYVRDHDLPRLAAHLSDLEQAVAAGTVRLTLGDAG